MRWGILLFFSFFTLAFSEGIKFSYLQVPSSYLDLWIGGQSVYVIEVDPSLYEIRPAKALDNGIGRESVLSISTRYGAEAGVNGGFFNMEGMLNGRAQGALKIHDWYALPSKPRGCIGWSADAQAPEMDRLLVGIEIEYEQESFRVDGINRDRREKEMILFTPCFHKTTLTSPNGEEIIVKKGVVEKIIRGGSSKIPEDGFVLSVGSDHPLYGYFEQGKPLSFSAQITPLKEGSSSSTWASLDYIVGGTPLLIQDGVKITDFQAEQTRPTFLSHRHARTAIGILPNENWVFVVVDKVGIFDGMTMNELADFMEDLGCVQALNLDGGGSSTIVYEGSIRNVPRGDEDEGKDEKTVRLVSDAILILPRK